MEPMRLPSAQATALAAQSRRPDIDFMRALIVLGLVLFHTARIFSLDTFYVSNAEKSFVATAFVAWAVVWGMPLMFFLSGQTVWAALGKRDTRQFLRERCMRLAVPFLFGLLVLVPPHLYLWLRNDPSYSEPYGQFLSRFFRVVPAFDFPWFVVAHPDSMLFEAAHLYFLYFLFAFTVLAMPLLLHLRRQRGRRWITQLAGFFQRPGAIFLLGIPAGAIEAALQSENYGGWNRYVFLLLFLYGYVIAGDTRFVGAMQKQSLAALWLALPATVLGFAVYVRAATAGVYLGRGYALLNVLWRMLKGVGGWWWVVAISGLGGRLLAVMPAGWREHVDSGRPSLWRRALGYANEAVLPFYMLHETIVVAVGFRVVRWQASMLVKYGVISLASLIATLAVYELLIRRNRVGRFLFGMRARGR